MAYRTRTYISGEWDGDSDAIDQIYKWNEGNKWNSHFGVHFSTSSLSQLNWFTHNGEWQYFFT